MSKVRIPESGRIAFRNLVGLGSDQFEQLVSAIRETRPAAAPDFFWKHVAERLPNIKREVVESIVDELFSLSSASETSGLPVDQFNKIILEAAVEDAKTSAVPVEQQTALQSRLTQLLDLKSSLGLTSKALDVLTDAERVYYSAKILTDVRPIFDEVGTRIEAAVIVHNLRIHFGKDSEHRDFVVALDTSDVAKLREVLDRADAKAKSLQAMLDAAKVSYLEVEN
jgi:hypothetical protein